MKMETRRAFTPATSQDLQHSRAKIGAPAEGNNYPENGLVKRPRRDTRAPSPAGMFGRKAPLRLAAQKSRPHAQ
jgi:hypothetical protein